MAEKRHLLRVAAAISVLGACTAALLLSRGAGLAASGTTTNVTIQTMDSCKSALGSAQYVLTGAGTSITATTPAHAPQTVGSGTCALQQGNCATFSAGCAQFTAVPYPGTYRFVETVTPPGNASNPEGYAPCNGGSACRSEVGTVVIDSTGAVSGTVLNVYPDGTTVTYPIASQHSGIPAYAGTPADPIVTHDFGLAPPGYNGAAQCDGDSDADDHSTGTPSSHCRYLPEEDEASACQPYPWSCTLGAGSTTSSATSSDPTTTTTTTTTSTTTRTATTSTGAACPAPTVTTFTGSAAGSSSTSEFVHPAAAGPFTATLSWTPLTTVDLIVDNGALATVGQTSGSSGSLSLARTLPVDSSYKVKVKNTGSTSIRFTLSVTHC
jgi:hypothetical protein